MLRSPIRELGSQVLLDRTGTLQCVVSLLSVRAQEHFGVGIRAVCTSHEHAMLERATSVYLRRWGIGDVCVQLVAIRSVLFRLIRSLWWCHSAVSRCHAGSAYASKALM